MEKVSSAASCAGAARYGFALAIGLIGTVLTLGGPAHGCFEPVRGVFNLARSFEIGNRSLTILEPGVATFQNSLATFSWSEAGWASAQLNAGRLWNRRTVRLNPDGAR